MYLQYANRRMKMGGNASVTEARRPLALRVRQEVCAECLQAPQTVAT